MQGLAERRMEAAQRSGGTSADSIKRLVLRLLAGHPRTSSILDFGAGRGELVRRLVEEEGYADVTGVDLLPRPDDLPASIEWSQRDLNDEFSLDRTYDVVICSEVIEHLENPRHTFRTLGRLLRPGGALILTMPNQESIRSYVGLILGGHFTHFLADSYPAHITALLRLDLVRICDETGFTAPTFVYSGKGAVPKLTRLTWQTLSLGWLKGRLFSDNVGLVTSKLDLPADFGS